MKIAILGSHGFIAGQLLKIWENVFSITCFSRYPKNGEVYFDLLHMENVDFSCFEELDYALFLAGNSSLEDCEDNPEEVMKVNVLATRRAIRAITEQGCRVLFFSSDAVFGKQEGELYEDSNRAPVSCYGQFKKAVEDDLFLKQETAIIRLPYVFCMEDKFTRYLMNCLKNKEQAEIYHPFSRTVISVMDLAELLLWIMNHWGIYPLVNACGGELVSRLDIANGLEICLGRKMDYRVAEMPPDFARLRPAVTNMRSRYVDKIIPERYGERFIDKVRREYERYQKMEGILHA